MYDKKLITGKRDYFLKEDRIISLHKDGFGSVVTRVIIQSNNAIQLEHFWGELHDVYNYGKDDKMKQIKKALEIR